jgi:acyl-CoA synthetase (AMP-forming)/AMP-acid ligase II
VDSLLARLRAFPAGAPAVGYEGQWTSYGELIERCARVAAALHERTRPGERIGLLELNSPAFLEVVLGATEASCVPVPINTRLAPPEIAYIIKNSGARTLFVGQEHYAAIESLAGQLPEDIVIIAMQGAGAPGWLDYEAWRDASRPDARARPPADDDDLTQLYTSGTTGHPKGAFHSLRNWNAWIRICRESGWGEYSPDTIMLVVMPMFHIAALGTALLALVQGARVVILRRFDPRHTLVTMEAERVTDTLLAPAIVHALLGHPEFGRQDLSSLRSICYGAAPMPPSVLEEVRARTDCKLVQVYGMTENLGLSTSLGPAEHDPALGKLASCGRPYAGTDLRIVDAEGRELPPGETGEIVVRGPTIFKGYWQDPEATAATLRGGWLHTGDAGYQDEDGFVFILDRVKDMIISGGENIYPVEVENALAVHSAVAEVAVIGVPDSRWGEAVKAIVVLKPGSTVEADDLIAFARERIARYKLPRSVEFVKSLPRNATGKLLRRTLREPYWAGHARRVH